MLSNGVVHSCSSLLWCRSRDVLTPDFDIAAKRRIFDSGFYKALNEPNMELVIGDSVTQLTPTGVITKSGRSIPADVIVLCTGFKVQDCKFHFHPRHLVKMFLTVSVI